MNRLYEGLFLLDANETAKRWSELESHVGTLLARSRADLQYAERWPDQKLAYEVKGVKKGTYYLTYFTAPTDGVNELRRDAELSEHVIRLLVIQEDWLADEMRRRQEAAARRSEPEPVAVPAAGASAEASEEPREDVSGQPVTAPADAPGDAGGLIAPAATDTTATEPAEESMPPPEEGREPEDSAEEPKP